jgi:translation initiation factor IF-3
MPPRRPYNSRRNEPLKPKHRINDQITATEMRVIDDDGQLGVMSLEEAKQIAAERGVDLVELVPNAKPPVVKVIDYGKYMYDLKKQEKKAKAKSKAAEMKEVRISFRIGDHDMQVKVRRAKKFLADGDKVKVNLQFKGREMAHKELGFERMEAFVKELGEEIVVEQRARLLGKTLFAIVRPK